MFDKDFEYFPTLKEVRDGLIGGQMRELDKQRRLWTDDARFTALQKRYIG